MSGAEWGVITSPRFPAPYEPPARGAASRVCNWFVTARPGKRLLLNFEHFAVEGHLTGMLITLIYEILEVDTIVN